MECLLNEVKIKNGQVRVNGKMYYVTQTPWVFTDTIKENVIFETDFNETEYNKVISKCGLNNVI